MALVGTVVGLGLLVLGAGTASLILLPRECDNARLETACTAHRATIEMTAPAPESRVDRARRVLYQDRVLPTDWRRVGVVTGTDRAFPLLRRRNRARRRWEYRVTALTGGRDVDLDLDRGRYREHLDDGDPVDVPGYGSMAVHLDADCDFCHFEMLE